MILRPSISEPSIPSMAAFAALASAKETNPNPRDLPDSRSFITKASVTSPNLSNSDFNRASSAAHGRPPTKSLLLIGVFSHVVFRLKVYRTKALLPLTFLGTNRSSINCTAQTDNQVTHSRPLRWKRFDDFLDLCTTPSTRRWYFRVLGVVNSWFAVPSISRGGFGANLEIAGWESG